MTSPDWLIPVTLNDWSADVFTFHYAPSHLDCPNGCAMRIWEGYSTVMVSPASGEWVAHSSCFCCKKASKWLMHPDLPFIEANVNFSKKLS